MKDFAGKVAVVTGGAGGIGRALVERFTDEGMRAVIADIDTEAGRPDHPGAARSVGATSSAW